MASRKNKKTMNNEGECSLAANKRRRIELMNGTTGVPFTNPVTEFPSIHLLQRQHFNQPPNTSAIGDDLQLSPPSAFPGEDAAAAAVDDPLSSLIPQQNFHISYHINQMMLGMEEFWRRNFAGEVKKRKDIEARLKQKDEQVDRFRQMYYFYEERTVLLEEMLQRMVAAGDQGCSAAAAAAAAPEEEVQSSLVDPNNIPSMDIACRKCRSRPATMLWLPCRHLCVCSVCDRRDKICSICGVKKTDSFMINLSLP